MNDEPKTRDELSEEELEETNGEPLPDREAMSVVPIGDPIAGDLGVPVVPNDPGDTLPVEPPATE
jgi:hypothetical protein